MGRPKRLYPLGRYRLRIRGTVDKEKLYLIEIEFTWNRQIIRKGMNIFSKVQDWDEKLNNGRGGVRASFGPDAQRINGLLQSRLSKIETYLAEYQQSHPNQITANVINDIISDKPITRQDKGIDFIEFTRERLASDYSRNRIGQSRYKNGLSGMNIFQEFLRANNKGTYKKDSIYVGDVTVDIIDEYITWRRDVKQNSDATINHALTPILKACAFAAELKLIDPSINAHIQDMRISPKISRAIDETEFDGKYLSQEELTNLIEYYKGCSEPRRREYIEMFLFAFHACGLRVVDIMTLQWSHIDFNKKEMRKILIKTSKRHVIPLSEPAISILQQWKGKRHDQKFVFDLIKDNIDIDNDEQLYRARNNATKCINQSLLEVGRSIGLKFNLTMHVARHTFAVMALNKGLSMSVVSRLLGHSDTSVTERVYAHFLPETLSSELYKLADEFQPYMI